ncbi:MAG: MFS transporter [Dehalococcoidales bacterium]|nr:MFS transporter [Dehalococcoidales bacterium]
MSTSTSSSASPGSLSHRQVFWTMVGVALAMLLSALDQTIVSTAMPRIIADLGGFSQYAWVTSIYMITSAITVPVVGKLSDMYGRKIFYLLGIFIFVAFSIFCGFSQNMTQLIVFRGIQGIGGGILMTLSFTVIADLFPPKERGKYQGVLTAVFSLASVVGPTTGGFLTDNISWHWVFFINGPLGLLVLLIFVKYFPRFRVDSLKHSIDYPGVCALILTVVPAMLALSWGGVEYSWGSIQIIAMLVFAVVMLGLFLFIESRSKEPIIPLSLFRDRTIAIANLISFVTGMGMFGAITYIPLYLQGVLGSSATMSGNLLIPMSIAVMITAFISGQILARSGGRYRVMGIISMSLICLGIFLFSRLNTTSTYWMEVLYTIIIGFGMGFSITIFTSVIQNTVPYSLLGVATSSTTFIRTFGGAIGLAILGSAINNSFFRSFTANAPEEVKNAFSTEQLAEMAGNPQVLVNPAAREQLEQALSAAGSGSPVFDQVMEGLRQALSSAISLGFLIGFAVLVVGLAAAFFLKDVPFKKDDRPIE